MYKNAAFQDNTKTMIKVEYKGVEMVVPAISGNRIYDDLIKTATRIVEYVPPSPTIADVQKEAARRMRELFSARDDRHLDILISNNLREALRLWQEEEGGGALSASKLARKQQLRWFDDRMEKIRAASNRLEEMEQIPSDYKADIWWS